MTCHHPSTLKPWRPLVLAAALNVTVIVDVATAQTVIVRKAPPGSTVEAVLNAATVGSATVDSAGDATVHIKRPAKTADMDAHVNVDVCDNGKLLRVLIVERGQQPPLPAAGCDRREIVGLFLVRPVSTLVVDASGPIPTLLLRQGSFSLAPPRVWSPSPTGLVLFGGGSLTKISNMVALACGDVTQCSGDDSGVGYSVGVSYWITRFLAAEGSYVRPAEVTANGSGSTYRFNSSLDAHVLTVGGKGGIPIGPVRIYGQLGATFHRATFGTTQTIDDTTVTVGDVTQTVKGGTQDFELRTQGWGWFFGGGVETWLARWFAIYGDVGRAGLKGSARGGGEGIIDDGMTFIQVGARVRIGR